MENICLSDGVIYSCHPGIYLFGGGGGGEEDVQSTDTPTTFCGKTCTPISIDKTLNVFICTVVSPSQNHTN